MSPPVLRVEQYRFFFFSNEGHEPPHVHAQDAEKLSKFWLDPVVVAASTGYSSPGLTRIRALVTQHRDMLLEAWHEFFRS